jgi:hypothetical protein
MQSIAPCSCCGEPLWLCGTCGGAYCAECNEHDEIGCAQDEDEYQREEAMRHFGNDWVDDQN